MAWPIVCGQKLRRQTPFVNSSSTTILRLAWLKNVQSKSPHLFQYTLNKNHPGPVKKAHSSEIKPHSLTSPIPSINSLFPSVSRIAGSIRTIWLSKGTHHIFSKGVLSPVFTDEEVNLGSQTSRSLKLDAPHMVKLKPARSPTTPPPRATIPSLRVKRQRLFTFACSFVLCLKSKQY